MNRRRSATLYAAFILAGVATTMLGPLLPALQTRWDIADSRTGLLFSAQFLASVASAAAVSVLARRYGYARLIHFGLLLVAAGVAGCAVCPWPLALPSVALYGCGLGLIIPAGNLGAASLNRGSGARTIVALNLCWCVGAVAAPVLIALLPSGFLWLQSLLAAVLAMWIGAGAWPVGLNLESRAQAMGPRHVVTALLLFLYVGAENSIGGWVALLTYRSQGALKLWAILPSAFWAGMLAGRAITPALLAMVGSQKIIAAGMLTAFGAATYLIAAHASNWSVAAGALGGFGLAPVFPLVVAQYVETLGAGSASGLIFSAAGLGGAALPALVGFLSQSTGSLRIGMSAVLVMLAAMACLQWRLIRTFQGR